MNSCVICKTVTPDGEKLCHDCYNKGKGAPLLRSRRHTKDKIHSKYRKMYDDLTFHYKPMELLIALNLKEKSSNWQQMGLNMTESLLLEYEKECKRIHRVGFFLLMKFGDEMTQEEIGILEEVADKWNRHTEDKDLPDWIRNITWVKEDEKSRILGEIFGREI